MFWETLLIDPKFQHNIFALNSWIVLFLVQIMLGVFNIWFSVLMTFFKFDPARSFQMHNITTPEKLLRNVRIMLSFRIVTAYLLALTGWSFAPSNTASYSTSTVKSRRVYQLYDFIYHPQQWVRPHHLVNTLFIKALTVSPRVTEFWQHDSTSQ